jgi:hypothetical protein
MEYNRALKQLRLAREEYAQWEQAMGTATERSTYRSHAFEKACIKLRRAEARVAEFKS